jgi:hypothetical protein|nr:MAG TPA: hypothetical protein [Bacteriophage sp.]
MVDIEKITSFKSFADKALKKMEERKKCKVKRYYIGDLDEEIELRGLSSEEFNDCLNYSENNVLVDKYTIYYASKTLQELAEYMVKEGILKEHLQLMDMFSPADRTKLANEVLDLSGVKDKSTVSDVEELKKS